MANVCWRLLVLTACASAQVTVRRPRELFEGDECHLDGVQGVCTRLHQCPQMLSAVQRGANPPRCGFLGFEAVVCCPRRRHSAGQRSNVGRLSQAACQDYHAVSNEIPNFFILNGRDTEAKEFPHMAALGFVQPGSDDVDWRCGGSLISDQYILTAAHCCTNRFWKQPVMVQLGSPDLTDPDAVTNRYSVARVLVHPGFRRPSHYHDVALVKLATRAELGERVMPACLYTEPSPPQGPLTVTGWGATNQAGTRYSSSLLKTEIMPVPNDVCQRYYERRFPRGLDDSVICAADPYGFSDTCAGDSGGPLQIHNDTVYWVVGITSLGPNPCGGSIPSIYTNVAAHLDWIETIVWGNGES